MHLEVKLASSKDDVLARLLDQGLDAWVSLVEQT